MKLAARSIGLLIAAFLAVTARAQAEDYRAEPDLELQREQWREHVRETKRRVQQEALQRRLENPHGGVEPSQEDEARRASESILNDDSLVLGDVVMTDKGMFVFRGRGTDADSAPNFEPVESSPGLRAKGQ